jgi:hypothetical protein
MIEIDELQGMLRAAHAYANELEAALAAKTPPRIITSKEFSLLGNLFYEAFAFGQDPSYRPESLEDLIGETSPAARHFADLAMKALGFEPR